MSTPKIDFFSEPRWANELIHIELSKAEQLPEQAQQKLQAILELSSFWSEHEEEKKQSKEEKESSLREGFESWVHDNVGDDLESIIKNSAVCLPRRSGFLEKQEVQIWQEPCEGNSERGEFFRQDPEPIDSEEKRNVKYKILTKQEKKFYVDLVKRTNLAQVSSKYGISVSNLNRWIISCDRKVGGGRKITDTDLESRIKAWIQAEKRKTGGLKLTRKRIQAKAKQWSNNPDFKASKGWLQRFVRRNNDTQVADILGINIRRVKRPKRILGCESFKCISAGMQDLAADRKSGVRYSERLKDKKYTMNGWTSYLEE